MDTAAFKQSLGALRAQRDRLPPGEVRLRVRLENILAELEQHQHLLSSKAQRDELVQRLGDLRAEHPKLRAALHEVMMAVSGMDLG